jgi:hypothetical protein
VTARWRWATLEEVGAVMRITGVLARDSRVMREFELPRERDGRSLMYLGFLLKSL